MNKVGWKELAVEAVRRHDGGDETLLDTLSELLEEQDMAKQSLREKGYGCTGMGWAQTVGEVDALEKSS